MKRVVQKLLGEMLLEQGKITQEELDRALKTQQKEGGLLGQILVKMKVVTEQEIVTTLATQFGYPYLPLSSCHIEVDILKLIPENVARQYHAIPIDRIGNTLTVVMADPTNALAIKDIEYTTSCKVQTFVATGTEIRESLNRFYKSHRAMGTEEWSADENVAKVDFANVARERQAKKDAEGPAPEEGSGGTKEPDKKN
ncbi:MAG: hypothetical protein HYY14_00985 [Candidatus Omnitrophica bacterium]|nr:hypothetical protein [Candidatus Omnitrophota bacterium]